MMNQQQSSRSNKNRETSNLSENRREERIRTICMVFLSLVATGVTLYLLRPILIPFVFAVFLTYVLTPVIDLQVKWLRFPRVVAFLGAFGVACICLLLAGLVLTTTVKEISSNAGVYQDQFNKLIKEWAEHFPFERFGIDFKDFRSSLNLSDGMVTKYLGSAVTSILDVVSNSLLVLIFSFFLIMGKTTTITHQKGILGDIEQGVKKYIVLKVVISILTGGLQGLVLWFFNVPFALVFGFMGFLLNFIPNLGPIVASLLPVPVVFLSPELSTATSVLAIGLTGGIHFLSGNVVEAKVLGSSLDLHPVVVLLSLIFFGMIWGMIGMFLATPITAVIKLIFKHSEFMAPIADLMAGRMDAFEEKI